MIICDEKYIIHNDAVGAMKKYGAMNFFLHQDPYADKIGLTQCNDI